MTVQDLSVAMIFFVQLMPGDDRQVRRGVFQYLLALRVGLST